MSQPEAAEGCYIWKTSSLPKTGCWFLLCFKAVSHVTDTAQTDTGIFFQIQLAANGLYMMADKLPGLAIVWLLPDFFINLVMCQHLVYVLKQVQENLILGFRERDLPPLAEYPALVFPDFQSRGTPL